jgi:hypothetical protein
LAAFCCELVNNGYAEKIQGVTDIKKYKIIYIEKFGNERVVVADNITKCT